MDASLPSTERRATAAPRDGTPGLLWACRFDADGVARCLADGGRADVHAARTEGWLWVHVDLVDNRIHDWLKPGPAIPAQAFETFLAADREQRAEVGQGYVCGAIADVMHDLDRASDRTGMLRFVLADRLVLSGRRHPLRATEAIRREVGLGRRMVDTSAFIEAVVGRIVEDFTDVESRQMARLDGLEDDVLAGRVADEGGVLAQVRRTTARSHRQVTALRLLIHRLERHGAERLGIGLHTSTTRLAHQLDDLDHDMSATQARARLLQEEVAARMAAITNRHLYALSFITTLFLPPALITGIFGMNTSNMLLDGVAGGTWWALGFCALSAAGTCLVMMRLGVLGRRRTER